MQSAYKKIPIQQLQQREQIKEVLIDQVQSKNLDFKGEYLDKPILCYVDTGLTEKRVPCQFLGQNFLQAFYNAYTGHSDILLIPDEVWIMIGFFVSKYIDKNAEKLRKKIVKHEGKMNLVVKQEVDTFQQGQKLQKQWDYFFEQIIFQIKQNTLEGVVDSFQCDFSTTTSRYKLISTSVVMGSFKQFFRFIRRISITCGINNVYMAGIREDWIKLITKLESMIKYDVDGELKNYISHIRKILQNFVRTYEGNPDVQWWNSVMTEPSHRLSNVCGGDPITQISGWILHFYGQYGRKSIEDLPRMQVEVPIQLVNQATGNEREVKLISGWVSVSKLNESTYKPDLGLGIFDSNQKSNMLRGVKKIVDRNCKCIIF